MNRNNIATKEPSSIGAAYKIRMQIMQIPDLKKNSKIGVIGIISDKTAPQLVDSSELAISRLSRFGSLKVSKLVHCLNRNPESRSGFIPPRLWRGSG